MRKDFFYNALIITFSETHLLTSQKKLNTPYLLLIKPKQGAGFDQSLKRSFKTRTCSVKKLIVALAK